MFSKRTLIRQEVNNWRLQNQVLTNHIDRLNERIDTLRREGITQNVTYHPMPQPDEIIVSFVQTDNEYGQRRYTLPSQYITQFENIFNLQDMFLDHPEQMSIRFNWRK